MTGDIKERIAAGYDEVGFMMTVGEIEHRLASRRRARTKGAAVAAAALALMITAAIWDVTNRPARHAVLAPFLSTAAEAAWDKKCAQLWQEREHASNPGRNRQRPPLLFNVRSDDHRMRVYLGDTDLFTCHMRPDGSVAAEGGASTLEDGPLLSSSPGTNISGFGHMGDQFHFVGVLPEGFTSADVVNPSGKVVNAELAGRHFLVWSPERWSGGFLLRAFGGNQMLAQAAWHDSGRHGPSSGPLEPRCRALAAAVMIEGMQPRFRLEVGGDRKNLLCGDDRTLVAGDTVLRSLHGPLPPFSKLNAVRQVGYLFGVAPEGAVSGTAVLKSGKTVELTVRDGFFAAGWETGDYQELPVRIEIRTPTHTWVQKGDQITRTAR